MRTNRAVMIVVAFLFSWVGITAALWPAEIKPATPSRKVAPPAAESQKVTTTPKAVVTPPPAESQKVKTDAKVLPQLILSSPGEGATLYGGQTYDVQWSSVAIPESSKVKIEYIRSDTVRFIVADNLPRSGKFSWKIGFLHFATTKVPGGLGGSFDVPVDTKGTVKVTTSSEGKTYGVERSISLVMPKLEITNPKEGDTWQGGKTYTVTWQKIGPASSNVTVQIQRGGLAPSLYSMNGVANTGSASVTVPTVDQTGHFLMGVFSDGGGFPETHVNDRVSITITK